jgi:hypothetical protein
MIEMIVSLSIASVLSALFCFRFHLWKQPKKVASYFLFFWFLEWGMEYFFLPPDIFGFELAIICFLLTGLIIAVGLFLEKLEKNNEQFK